MNDTVELARRIRVQALRMTRHANASHIGSCLSAADLLAVLYGAVMAVAPDRLEDESRDRFLMSKGHAAAALYACLAECGFFPRDWLTRYCDDDSPLTGHVTHKGVPGVEVSTGALGHGLSIACGFALAGRAATRPFRSYALLSDGELDEGSVWEAALFAAHHRLGNLTALIDANGIQSFGSVAEVLDTEPLADKWRAFGWRVSECDGHDQTALRAVLAATGEDERPHVLIARTVKGKGISFMENQLLWHYRSVDDALLADALAELGEPA